MRLERSGRRLLIAGAAALLLLVAVPVVAFAWLLWEEDELIPYPDGPPSQHLPTKP